VKHRAWALTSFRARYCTATAYQRPNLQFTNVKGYALTSTYPHMQHVRQHDIVLQKVVSLLKGRLSKMTLQHRRYWDEWDERPRSHTVTPSICACARVCFMLLQRGSQGTKTVRSWVSWFIALSCGNWPTMRFTICIYVMSLSLPLNPAKFRAALFLSCSNTFAVSKAISF
jgi:hypothetical protein